VPPTDVAHYYDRNTRRFLLMGSGRRVYSMHRELWGPGVASAREAVGHIDRLIGDEIERLVTATAPVVIDFGCGVGGTLFYLAHRFPGARLNGITLSARQVELAERFATGLDVADRCAFSLGDFHTAGLEVRADAIVAVESFTHADSADAFLENATKHLRPGGCLIIADDFLASEPDTLDTRQRNRVEQFQAGWRVPSVCTAEHLVDGAARHGLVAEKVADLTSLTRPGSRVRDRLTAALSPLLVRLGLGRIPFCGNLIGGDALQIGLRDGYLRYRLLVFRKQA
jgi:cyclopropane fatty-acyl-phospholipid synthase-like methyltransferase